MKYLVIFSIFILSLSGHAEDKIVKLATVSTAYIKKTYDLRLVVNDRELITGFQTMRGPKPKLKKYTADVLSREIPLVKTAGISLVTLKCKSFNTSKGCELEIEYPYNITYGKFKKFNAQLKRVGRTWGLYANGKKFTQMDLISKTFLGVLIGIKRIDLK